MLSHMIKALGFGKNPDRDQLKEQAEALFGAGDFAAAAACYGTLAQLLPGDASILVRQAFALRESGDKPGAAHAAASVLRISPENTDAHYLLASLAAESGRIDEALQHYRAVLQSTPGFEPAWQEQCMLLYQHGRAEEAYHAAGAAIQALPASATLRLFAGNFAYQRQDYPQAAEHFAKALALQPEHTALLDNLGLAQLKAGRLEAAEDTLRHSLQLAPGSLDATLSLGNVLLDLGRYAEAVDLLQQAYVRHGEQATLLGSLGLALLMTHQPEAAAPMLQRAIELDPNSTEVYLNLGKASIDLGRHAEARTCFERAIAIKPDHIVARYNLGYVDLLLGEFEAGWRGFDYRDLMPGVSPNPSFPQPLFSLDADVTGKKVLLVAEQGLGDTLQFIRYAELVAQRGAEVMLAVPRALRSLAGASSYVSSVLDDATVPHFDFHAPLMSLPAIFKTDLATVPSRVPYLQANPERRAFWQARLGPAVLPRVGLVWSGDPRKSQVLANHTDAMRSIRFERFLPLFDVPGIEFHSLQVGPDAVAQSAGHPQVADHAAELFDFQETAALVEQLDLVISVDTSVVHLAGALGKPVWMLNRHNTCWRWMLERADSPWYPSMRIFRQPALGDWDSVMADVLAALRVRYQQH